MFPKKENEGLSHPTLAPTAMWGFRFAKKPVVFGFAKPSVRLTLLFDCGILVSVAVT